MNVLITGYANGIGEAVIKKYASMGHFCVGIDIINGEKMDNVVGFVADTRDEDSLNIVKNYLEENKIDLDLIINIAGIHRMASLVETDFETIKKVIDINLTGTMLVNHTFYNFLKEKGKIIIVTSEVSTYTPMPFNGLYNISKSALETYADTLRQELNLLNQQVITIRPGAVETKLAHSSVDAAFAFSKSTKLFQKQGEMFHILVSKFFGKTLSREKLANKIYKVSIKKHPKLSYSMHRTPGLVLLNLLPKRMQLFIIKMMLNRNSK